MTEIKDRFNGDIIIEVGRYASIKDAVENNRKRLRYAYLMNADLTNAKLTYANLMYADLTGTNLTNANLEDANLTGAKLMYADLMNANLENASLTGTDLTNANLMNAKLRHAKLSYADLTGIRNYSHSKEIFFELIRAHKVADFTDNEWAMIGQIMMHRPCWDSIYNRYGNKIMSIFKKLSTDGFNEFENRYEVIL